MLLTYSSTSQRFSNQDSFSTTTPTMASYWRVFLTSLLKRLACHIIVSSLFRYFIPGYSYNIFEIAHILYVVNDTLGAKRHKRPAIGPGPSPGPGPHPGSVRSGEWALDWRSLQECLKFRRSTALERESHRLATMMKKETAETFIAESSKHLEGQQQSMAALAERQIPEVSHRPMAIQVQDLMMPLAMSNLLRNTSERKVAQFLEIFHKRLRKFSASGYLNTPDAEMNERVTAFRTDEGLMLILTRTALGWYAEHDETNVLCRRVVNLIARTLGFMGDMENDTIWDGTEKRYGRQWQIMLYELCSCTMEIDKLIKELANVVFQVPVGQLSISLKPNQLLAVFLDFLRANLEELLQFRGDLMKTEEYYAKADVREVYVAVFSSYDFRMSLRKNKANMIASVMEQMEALREELHFLIMFLNDIPLQCSEFGQFDLKHILEDIEAVANQTGRLCQMIFIRNVDINYSSFLSDLLQKTKFIKLMIKASVEDFSKNLSTRTLNTDRFIMGFATISKMEHLQGLFEQRNESTLSVMLGITSIHKELTSLRSMIKDKGTESFENEDLKEVEAHFAGLIGTADYLVDSMVVQSDNYWYYSNRFSHVVKGIELAKKRVATKKEVTKCSLRTPETESAVSLGAYFLAPPPVLTQVMVEFSLEGTIKEQLLREERRLELISIVGMPGLGKTTLARKIYDDLWNLNKFDVLAWCTVSQAYQRRGLLLDILKSIGTVTDETVTKSDEDLAYALYQYLVGKRYIIVIDDICSMQPWQDLCLSFPDNSTGSRIVFTSRNDELVQSYDKWPHTTYNLPFLSDDTSWYLLRNNVFRNGECPAELEKVGKEIAMKCEGLPLAVNLIAGVLARRNENPESWEEVVRCLSSYIVEDSSMCDMVLEQSYMHLPDDLKPCFLYCGSFPQRKTIQVQKLMRLWIAEGFIITSGQNSLEKAAENCLTQLIGRNLLLVSERRSNGSVKACRIHSLLHDFCLRKARDENFLKVIDSSYATYEPHRRLAITLDYNLPDMHSCRSFGPHLRSLLMSNAYNLDLYSYVPLTSFHFTGSKLLKVLDLENIDSDGSFPCEIAQLVLLKYLAIRGLFYVIPSALSNLHNLETLIIVGATTFLPDAIFSMPKLKHLHLEPLSRLMFFGVPTKFFCAREKVSELQTIQTLRTIRINQVESEDTLIVFPHLQNLKCFIDQIVIDSTSRFPVLDFLSHLEILSATYMTSQPPQITTLIFPPSLKQLSLSYFYLPWNEMSAVGRLLPNLEVLKLRNYAFVGDEWNISTYEVKFPKLKFLRLQNLDIKRWIIGSCDQFPSLQRLVIQDCKALEGIPDSFADMTSLQVIQIQRCSDSTVQSALQIKEIQQDYGNEDFKVLIRNGTPMMTPSLSMFR